MKLLGEATTDAEAVSWNGLLYYLFAGQTFWQSDGTEAGTQPFDSTPGFTSRFPRFLTPASSGLFYETWGTYELWVTDGTPAGTQRLYGGPSNPLGPPTPFRNGVAFSGPNLWLSDGTPDGTASGPLVFYTLAPCRVFDTRSSTPLVHGSVRTFSVAGSCGIPADAEAVAANLTVINPTSPGNIALWPAGAPSPGTSSINFATGVTRANNATLSLNGAGAVEARATLAGAGPHAHLVLDVSGYYRPGPADE